MHKHYGEKLLHDIKEAMEDNDNKIPYSLIEKEATSAKKIFIHPTPTTRICILILQSGHEVIGVSRVLDPLNDDEEIGNKVALNHAKTELWNTIGTIAKLYS